MSDATIGLAIKTLIQNAGLGLKAYVDREPDSNEQLPFVTVHEAISITPTLRTSNGVGETASELVQVDLWQQWFPDDQQYRGDQALATELTRVLHQARLDTAPMRVDTVLVQGVRRLFEPGREWVHHAITLRLERAL